MVNKVYMLASLIAASGYVYYKCKKSGGAVEDVTIMDDIPIPQEDEQPPEEKDTSTTSTREEDEECECCCYYFDKSCNEPLRASKKLLAVVGPKDGDECIYNICEIITLLDTYLSSHNLMTHQTVAINYPLSKLLDLQECGATIDYTELVKELLEHHTSKF